MIINNSGIKNEYINVYSLNSRKIYLPIFQRGFSWKPEQTEKLLENISDMIEGHFLDEKQIYLLDFIGFEENGRFKLADGQQRLITVAILTKCVIELSQANNIPYDIKEYDIEYEDMSCQKKWENFCNGKIEMPFKKVYIRLKEYVENNLVYLSSIENILKNNLYVFMKMADNADDAFDVFEQINTGGKPLSKDEIIKTIITQYSARYGTNICIEGKELKNALISYCKYTCSSNGNFTNLAIMSFLDKYVVKDKQSFIDFTKYIEATKDVKGLSITYIAKQLNRLQLLDMIYAYRSQGVDLKVKTEIIEDVFYPLFLLCAIFSLNGVNPGGRIKSFLDNILNMIKRGDRSSDIQAQILKFASNNPDICNVSLNDFSNLLVGKTKQPIMKSLMLMDIAMNNTSLSFTPELINLEHIYPQKPKVDWASHGWPVNEEEQEQYIYNIGNYLILNSTINKKIQTEYIAVKRGEYEKIIPNDAGLQTQINTVDFDSIE